MDIEAFARFHLPALEADEVAFNVQIAVLQAAAKETPASIAFWSLGSPGHLALQTPGRNMLLGLLDETETHALADLTRTIDYPGVMGPREVAGSFVREATAVGARFGEPVEMRVQALTQPPRFPGAPGEVRLVAVDDAPLLYDWICAFQAEAVPHEPVPLREGIERSAASGRYVFWTFEGEPVSVACMHRSLKTSAAVGSVYTPPEHRGRGYAGSVVAECCARIFAGGKQTVCLYTNLANPASNHCYEKIGFRKHCDTAMFHRAA